MILSSYSVAAAEKRCECKFADPQWTAYGTKAACTAWMHESKRSCNVAFAGIGADMELIPEVLFLNSDQYADLEYGVSIDYLTRLRKGDVASLTETEFLQVAIPTFMRAALIRGTPDEAMIADMRTLDDSIVSFMKGRAEDVGKAFRGEIDTFVYTDEKTGAVFTVGEGTIIVDYKGGKIVTTFLPGE